MGAGVILASDTNEAPPPSKSDHAVTKPRNLTEENAVPSLFLNKRGGGGLWLHVCRGLIALSVIVETGVCQPHNRGLHSGLCGMRQGSGEPRPGQEGDLEGG